jgi:epoxyqueuosine reductase
MIKNIIKKHLTPSEDFIFGFADLHGLIDRKFDGFYYGISIGRKLDDKIIDKLEFGPTIEYFKYYNQVNTDLAKLTGKIHADLLKMEVDSLSIIPTISPGTKGYEKYMQALTYDISHKMVATRAGLGWIGKTDLFISKAFGPRLRLVSMLINENPGIDSIPIDESKCGKCNICVEKCPANAANGKLWNTKVHRDEFFNAQICREKCGELAKKQLNIDERICGLCINVCPIGKRKLDK